MTLLIFSNLDSLDYSILSNELFKENFFLNNEMIKRLLHTIVKD